MNQWQVISVIALVAWLVLAIGSYRSRQISGKRTVLMAVVWIGLFGLIAMIFTALER